MNDIWPAATLTISIDCPVRQVYEFAANPANLPRWATAFCRSVRQVGGQWLVETPEGEIGIEFVPRNASGVLDHQVRLPGGATITVPMRVVPNGHGSEVMLTLFQSPGMSAEKFAEDADWVRRDLATLKATLEAAVAF